MTNKNKKVFVAMSGGVDSSVVAGLMKEQGYDVVGVTMCFSITHPNSKKPSCCGVDGIADARRAAQILDIPHYVLDFAGDIQEYIIDNFVSEYLNGRTPNPCVRCNQYLKFGTLYKKVMALGADYLATGHYVQLEFFQEGDQTYKMKTAVDMRKDQSYFLYSIKKETLSHLLFPLGKMVKGEVRTLARKYDLNTADKPESQDICFVSDTGYKQFIKDRVGEEYFIPGDFISEEGRVVGQHKGIANYTIGQRDKLGIALGVPVYVYNIDKEKNTVHVGPKECLYSQGLVAKQVNFLKNISQERMEINARIRYNAPEVKGYLTCLNKDRIHIDFAEPQMSVTPGQSVVLYDGDVVIGGGIIKERM